MDSTVLPEFRDVEAAASRIAGRAFETPLLENAALNRTLGRRVLLKLESLQRTGSFKIRGATNRIALIPETERAKGVVAFSSGNHAQGVAAAAGQFGIPATIVMPADAPRAKLEGTKALGARIVFYDRAKDDREAIAAAIAEASSATLIRPFDDPGIIAGQATAGLELIRQASASGATLESVLVPCGGGGLVSGIALALSQASPSTKVFSVEPENFDGMRRSLASGKRVSAPGGATSIADALMSPAPGHLPFALAAKLGAMGLVVNDRELAAGVAYAAGTLKLIIEPGGSAGLSAALAGHAPSGEGALGIVVSGGNCDLEMLEDCISRTAQP